MNAPAHPSLHSLECCESLPVWTEVLSYELCQIGALNWMRFDYPATMPLPSMPVRMVEEPWLHGTAFGIKRGGKRATNNFECHVGAYRRIV